MEDPDIVVEIYEKCNARFASRSKERREIVAAVSENQIGLSKLFNDSSKKLFLKHYSDATAENHKDFNLTILTLFKNWAFENDYSNDPELFVSFSN